MPTTEELSAVGPPEIGALGLLVPIWMSRVRAWAAALRERTARVLRDFIGESLS
jgi:hypothetical protein